MSLPNFPVISPEITREKALNMIIASIAMEELGLSHIINAEGEKLQYILGTLPNQNGSCASVKEILDVNKSITELLDTVMQNQIFLKSKLEKVLNAQIHCDTEESCSADKDCCSKKTSDCYQNEKFNKVNNSCFNENTCLEKCTCKGSALFEGGFENYYIWKSNCHLPWSKCSLVGDIICFQPSKPSEIVLAKNHKFLFHLLINVKPLENCNCHISVSLQTIQNKETNELYTFHLSHCKCSKNELSINGSGMIITATNCVEPFTIVVTLNSPECISVYKADLSIVQL